MKDYKLLVFTISHNKEKLIVSIQQIPHGERGTWIVYLIWQAPQFCERYTEVEIPLIIGDDPGFWERFCYQHITKMILGAMDTDKVPKSCKWMFLFNKSFFTAERWSTVRMEKSTIEVKQGSEVVE